MIKGISRRVVVVKSPDPEIFDEAIFIVRDDYLKRGGTSPEAVLREAQRTAERYLKENTTGRRRLFSRIPPSACAAAGAAATGIAWLALRLVGV
jgi:hypothetical protein